MSNLLLPTKKQSVLYLRILYPIWMFFGMFSLLYVSSTLIIEGNPIETWKKISEHETLFRLGIASGLITQLLQIIAVVFLYKLFSDTDSGYSKLLAIFGLTGVAISMSSYLFQLGALLVVNSPSLVSSFDLSQQQSIMMLLLELGKFGITIATLFWGLWLLPLGYLANKSMFFPKFVGYALYIGGIGYLINAFSQIIIPRTEVIQSISDAMTFGEMVFVFWLIIMGAKLSKDAV